MFKKYLFVYLAITLIMAGIVHAQSAPAAAAQVSFNGITFSYDPAVFGAVLPAYDAGTPFQADAPYFANNAPHTTFLFTRPDPARPDVNLTGELGIYRIADIEAYAEPSYKDVVDQLRTLDTSDLSAYETVGADYKIPALPFMPVLNATQVFRAHPQALNFKAVNGIEYYTYYSQSPEPIIEGQVMYAYQGIATDGKYYLSFSIYIEMGLLETKIADGIDWDAFGANYAQYLQDTYDTIKGADPATFTPTPDVLHSFIESISIAA
ncbi:MAG: hypothetical protein ABI690_12720 [Chloroflexota bacterium]